MRYLIGIDIGTSATKTILMDEEGNVAAQAVRIIPYISQTTAGRSRRLRIGSRQRWKP